MVTNHALMETSSLVLINESADGLVHRSLDDPAVVQPSFARYVPCLECWVRSFRDTLQLPTCMRCVTAAL